MTVTNQGRITSICATPQPDDVTNAELEGLTYIAISNVGNIGETGGSEAVVTYSPMDTDVIQKAKGVRDAGDPTVEVSRQYDDPGQILLRAAAKVKPSFAFKFEMLDSPDGILTNTVRYNLGKVTGPSRPNGGVDDIDLEIFTLLLHRDEHDVDPV